MAHSPLSSSIENVSTSGRWADDVDSASTSDDEIVWSLSSSPELDSQGAGSRSPLSDDFILISRAGSPGGIASVLSSPRSGPSADSPELIAALSSMSLSPAASSNFSSFVVNIPKAKTSAVLPASPAAKVKQQQQPPTPKSPATVSKRAKKAGAKTKAKQAQEASSQPQPTTPKKKAPNAKSASASYPSPPSSPAENRSGAKKAKKAANSQSQNPPAGYARSVVDDASSVGGEEASSADSDSDGEKPSPAYFEARKFMTSYLANPPPAGNNGSTLLLMQALIIELGLDTTRRSSTSKKPTPSPFSIANLPNTMTQAKLLLKGSAFINIRDYLDVREQGQGALRRAMHPSRSALAKDLRKKRMPLGWVKKTGLNVLLVNTRFN
ncbi:hypothetical protein EWM64_g3768 [Hericium alpestre]|uniref:Uncharacterized protein n=1 Tax=Hericium alpestre TaxID=135208 RepID=A0A4Z0A187_9AGAM|nr:hypothetical protein EWM64_g3768 [Hericium alpestre]